MSSTEKLNWRYATKKFDHTKKLNPAQLDELLSAILLAPSSYGLQPYRVVVVEDAETRVKLREASHGQAQITDSSQLIIFAAETSIDPALVKKHIDLVAQTRNVDRAQLAGYEQMLNGMSTRLTAGQALAWAQKQAYIALGVMLDVAAELQIDTCPMEGFDASKYDEILGLKQKGLTASVVAAIGFRAADDPYSKLIKVRKAKADMFIHV